MNQVEHDAGVGPGIVVEDNSIATAFGEFPVVTDSCKCSRDNATVQSSGHTIFKAFCDHLTSFGKVGDRSFTAGGEIFGDHSVSAGDWTVQSQLPELVAEGEVYAATTAQLTVGVFDQETLGAGLVFCEGSDPKVDECFDVGCGEPFGV